MMKDELDQMLSSPLAEIQDDGFSRQFTQQLASYEKTRKVILTIISVVLGLVFVSFYPVVEWLEQISLLVNSFAESVTTTQKSTAISNYINYALSIPLLLIAYAFVRMEQ
ncbi:DUF5056 domain-containing protein [Thalassotalea sp. M1531]|uniref:DUF5056 domain-containing protein n=1 Tax=Thalassotalea algicola TaxID=2716224 RepID=A0A7Y0LCG9_9GAMM|nr:DUF5056 domain-containing protein [Thalassotalea algicola]NMP31679.1 DUF5056 domain-containing protein [Thalassotalea algicola]